MKQKTEKVYSSTYEDCGYGPNDFVGNYIENMLISIRIIDDAPTDLAWGVD